MAAQRPTASDGPEIPASSDEVGVGRDDDDAITHAQTRALRRCSPLSTTEFKAQREVIAQQHRWSVMRILRHAAGDEDDVAPRQPAGHAPAAITPDGRHRLSRRAKRDA